MEHSEKVRQLDESRERRRQAGIVIYPVANQQGCAMAPFAFAHAAEQAALQGASAGTMEGASKYHKIAVKRAYVRQQFPTTSSPAEAAGLFFCAK